MIYTILYISILYSGLQLVSSSPGLFWTLISHPSQGALKETSPILSILRLAQCVVQFVEHVQLARLRCFTICFTGKLPNHTLNPRIFKALVQFFGQIAKDRWPGPWTPPVIPGIPWKTILPWQLGTMAATEDKLMKKWKAILMPWSCTSVRDYRKEMVEWIVSFQYQVAWLLRRTNSIAKKLSQINVMPSASGFLQSTKIQGVWGLYYILSFCKFHGFSAHTRAFISSVCVCSSILERKA